ncbi:hypothetical protein [Paraburkholderia strydomiana]|uniref:hypothetical protein n=1 Tax=Paraburkholderia strydomiana TaxID=1245417 RepID=UPI0038BD2099
MDERDHKTQVEAPINTGATPTIVAFTFQFERALYRLFSSHTSSSRIGLETLDDVAELIYRDNGIVEARLEQDAHTVQAGAQPYQDSSRKLWHTLRVWLSHLDDLRVSYPKSKFYLVTNASVPKNAFVRLVSDAESDAEVIAAVSLLRKHAAKIVKNKKSEAKTEAEIVQKYGDDALKYLIRNLSLLDKGGTGSEVAPREAAIQLFHLQSKIAGKAEDIRPFLGRNSTSRVRCTPGRLPSSWPRPPDLLLLTRHSRFAHARSLRRS